MCRNIRTLYNFEPPATDEEIHAAALQFVRKISGYTKPSQVTISRDLLAALETTAPPKDREIEKAKAKARAAKRFGTA